MVGGGIAWQADVLFRDGEGGGMQVGEHEVEIHSEDNNRWRVHKARKPPLPGVDKDGPTGAKAMCAKIALSVAFGLLRRLRVF